MSSRKVLVRVDHDLCVGNAMCRAAAPGVFVADENGQSVVADLRAGSLEQILEAAGDCPVSAISVRDAQSGEYLFPQARDL